MMMDDDTKEFVQRVAKADEKAWENIKAELQAQEKNLEDVVPEMEAIYNEDFFEEMPDPVRFEHTSRIFYSRLLQANLSSTSEFEVYVIDKTAPRPAGKENILGQVFGLGYEIPDEDSDVGPELGFVSINFWGDEAPRVKDAEVGTSYRLQLNGGFEDGYWQCAAEPNTTFVNEIEEDEDLDVEDVLEALFPVVEIADTPHNVSDNREDKKLIKATVMNCYARRSEKGNMYGRYVVSDNSVTSEFLDDNGPFGIMVNPSQVRFAQNSELYFLGQITYSDEYGYGMNADCVVPLLGIPREEPELEDEGAEELGEPTDIEDEDQEVVDFEDF